MADQRKRLGERLSRAVGQKEERKVQARREKHRTVWFGFRMFGLVGWAVAIPTVVGALLGLWLDRTHPSRYSWTLTLLFLGIIVGCLNAWLWVSKENRRIHEREEKESDE
jgi:ATP synthase protein I